MVGRVEVNVGPAVRDQVGRVPGGGEQLGRPAPDGEVDVRVAGHAEVLAARKLGADPRRCLVVEDAEAGVRAGRAAGATVAALKGVPADIQITGLNELTSLLGQAENLRA